MSTFNEVLRGLRKQYVGKQFTLAVDIGCTEAAVSLWEHGRRLPQRATMPRIVAFFRSVGALADEVAKLQDAYEERKEAHVRKDRV